MFRRGLLFVLFIGVTSRPLAADLKYTMRMDAHPVTVAPSQPSNPMLAALGGMVIGLIAPPGGLTTRVVVGTGVTRVEYVNALGFFRAGTVAITRADGTLVVLDPAAKTFWKATNTATPSLAEATTSVTRTGEFADVGGVRTERMTFEVRAPLPFPPGTPQIQGIPAEMVMQGQSWVSDRFKSYVTSGGLTSALAGLGLDKVAAQGFPMRVLMRSDFFGAQEIEMLASDVAEFTAPPGTFDVPAGYTEVSAPMGMATVPAGE